MLKKKGLTKSKKRKIEWIHFAKNELALGEENYRQLLQGLTGKASTKDMDITQLILVVRALERRGGRLMPGWQCDSALNLKACAEFRKLHSIWLDMGARGVIRDKSEVALVQWVKRETSAKSLQWIDVPQLIEKLRQWEQWLVRKK